MLDPGRWSAELMGETDNQHEGTPHGAVRSRLGMLMGEFAVPSDFDQMEKKAIADLFEGISKD